MHAARQVRRARRRRPKRLAHAPASCRSRPTSPQPSTAPSTRSADDARRALAPASTHNPELRFEEHKACGVDRASFVERAGTRSSAGVAGMPTAFRARAAASGGPARRHPRRVRRAARRSATRAGTTSSRPAPSARSSRAAAVAEAVGGEVVLLGTPAEEGGGGKIEMIEAGVFDGRRRGDDVPPLRSRPARAPGARVAVAHVRLQGRALRTPRSRRTPGTSALTACLDTFRLVDGQRVHFRDGVRVHGYVTDGGQAVNIIPERAACEFSVRALDGDGARRASARIVERCARGAAHGERRRGRPSRVRHGYRDMVNNMALARALRRAPRGARPRAARARRRASAPAAPTWATSPTSCRRSIPGSRSSTRAAALCHEHRFAEAAATDGAGRTALVAAKALARTAVEFLADAALRADVSAEWAMRSSTVTSIRRRWACCRISVAPAPGPWPPRAAARSVPSQSSNATRVPVEDDPERSGSMPSAGARDAERQEVAGLDPVVAHDDAAHVGAQHRGQRR